MPTIPKSSTIEKVHVKTNGKVLSTFVHWPSTSPPLTSPPTNPTSDRRIVALILHPHPKMGGNAHNNVVDALSNIFSNGSYLSYKEVHDGRPVNLLYDVSHYGPGVQKSDLVISQGQPQIASKSSSAPPSSQDQEELTFTSKLLGPLTKQVLPNPHRAFSSGEKKSGVISVRFHTSGVEDSDGSSTWTGNKEVEDVVTILSWIMSPQSKIFPTDLFLIGYSFGACLLGTALNRILNFEKYKQDLQFCITDYLTTIPNVLRGVCFISYPCGFLCRSILGAHLTNIRSLTQILCQPPPHTAPANSPPASSTTLPMMYFVIDQDDELTGVQTLVNVLQSCPHPVQLVEKQKMLQVLATRSGHFWASREHILALLLASYMVNRIDATIPILPQLAQTITSQTPTDQDPPQSTATAPIESESMSQLTSRKGKTSKDELTTQTSQSFKQISPKMSTANPLINIAQEEYKDDQLRVCCHDLNIWIVCLIVFMILGKLVYNKFESHIQRELSLSADLP